MLEPKCCVDLQRSNGAMKTGSVEAGQEHPSGEEVGMKILLLPSFILTCSSSALKTVMFSDALL